MCRSVGRYLFAVYVLFFTLGERANNMDDILVLNY